MSNLNNTVLRNGDRASEWSCGVYSQVKDKRNTFISEPWHGDANSSQRNANTHIQRGAPGSESFIKKGWGTSRGIIQKVKDNTFCVWKWTVFSSSQLRSHVLFHNSLLPPGGRGVADMLRGSLCYLETDSLSHSANRWLWKTAFCFSIGPPLPGAHSSINSRVIVSSGNAEANYTAPFLCSDLFSPAVPLHTYKGMDTHTHTRTHTHRLTHAYKSPPTPQNVTTRDRGSLGIERTWNS